MLISSRTRKLLPLLAAATLALSACASTSRSDQGAAPPPGDEASIPPGAPAAASPTIAATVSPASGPGTRAPARGGGSSVGTRRPTPRVRVLPPGQGITAKEVRIGFWFLVKGDACEAIGASDRSSCGTGNDDLELQALVRYINGHGGIAGRKLVPIVYRTDAVRSSWAAQAQAACEHFLRDEKVFTVVSEGEAGRPFMTSCIAKQRIPVIDPAHWPWDATARRPYLDYFYQPQRPVPERWVKAYIDGLWDQGFFQKDSRIGLIRFDGSPFNRLTENVLKPRLAAHGLKLLVDAPITTPPSVSGYGDLNTQINSAILRFKSARVDRMLFLETMSEITLFYFPQAEAADFHPRYGVSTMEYLDSQSRNATASQLRGAVGIGWAPYYDVAAANDPGRSAAALRCDKIIAGAGGDSHGGRNPKCDTLFFLKEVLDRADAGNLGLNASGFRASAESLGTSFRPAASFGASFGPGDHQGPAAYRYVAYDTSCSCFKYRGSTRSF